MFRERLTALLAREGLTQQQLAAATGLSQSTISHYLRGTRALPRAEELLALSRHFGVSMEWLLGADEESVQKSPAVAVKDAPIVEGSTLLQVADALHEQVKRLRQLAGDLSVNEKVSHRKTRQPPSG